MLELAVVIPVYNEEAIIAHVARDWVAVLRRLKVSFRLYFYNDGSKDGTLGALRSLEKEFPEVAAVDKPNSGHGPTVLTGYRTTDSDWVFQVDSDNEMAAEHFPKLWEKRAGHDFLLGVRVDRRSPPARQVVSAVSRLTVRLLFGAGITDANSPYRLYRRAAFAEAFRTLPADTFAPNVLLSGYAAWKRLRILEVPIPYRFRQTGEVSIKRWKLFKCALRSFRQALVYRTCL